MSSSEPRLPEQFRSGEMQVGEFHVNELAADRAGAMSPFGPDAEFPLPLDKINYTHPSPEHRPNLAGGLQ